MTKLANLWAGDFWVSFGDRFSDKLRLGQLGLAVGGEISCQNPDYRIQGRHFQIRQVS